MRTLWIVLGLVLVASGAVWIAQGFNLPFAPGSFMTAQPAWVLIGIVAVVVGLTTVLRTLRAR